MERKLPDEDGGRRGRRRRRARDASLPTKQVAVEGNPAVDSEDPAVCKRQLPSGDTRADCYQESLVSKEPSKFSENTESDDPKVLLEGNSALDSKDAAICKKQIPSGTTCADLYQESVTSEEQGKFAENTESDDPKVLLEGNPALDSKDAAVCKKQLPSGGIRADCFQESLASEEHSKFAEDTESNDPKVLLEGNSALDSKDAAVCKKQLPSGDTCADLYQESVTSEEQGKFAENTESDDPKVLVEGNPALDTKEAAVCRKQLPSGDTCADLYQDSEIVLRCYLIADNSDADDLDSIEDSENDDDAYSFALAPDPFIEELPEEAVDEESLDMCSLTIDDSSKVPVEGNLVFDTKEAVSKKQLPSGDTCADVYQDLAKGKEKVEVNSERLQQLKHFSEEFIKKSSNIGKVFQESGGSSSKLGKLRSMVDDIKALAEHAKVRNFPGHDVHFEIDAAASLSSAREGYLPKKKHGETEPIIWKGVIGVPSYGLTGNPDIDSMNSSLADCYSMIGYILEERLKMLTAFSWNGAETIALDMSMKRCIHKIRTVCKQIRREIIGQGGEPLKEPLVYWRGRYVGLKF